MPDFPLKTSNPLRLRPAVIALAILSTPLAAEPVDLELVIATDVSRSVNSEEAQLQREGVAQAFRSAEVIQAIERGGLGKIAVAYVDWSTEYINRVVVNWQVISDSQSATFFAHSLLQAPPTWGQRTSISSVMLLGTEMIENNDLEGTRRVIDISGDGPNNFGLSLAPVREETIAKGIIINGLPIIVEGAEFAGRGFFPDVDRYYQRCVIGGAGSFLVVAKGFEDFAAAIRRKLVLEISDLMPDETDYAEADPAQGYFMRIAATPGGSQSLPDLPGNLPILRAPETRDEDCDRWSDGFGGYNNFGRP
jgi:hypothetical protein